MTPTEWAWLYEQKTGPKMYGSMTEAEVAALYERAYGRDDEEDY